ncbi:hypothetical protein CTAYLR_001933 [Chrysophaeum taylorii]|uniref:Uncharacterized protein n=1 Tax=Chrysophaeum taylorii TaxID=2483200 RepID=A0AAD7U8G7_9STRA|nr:hypothetical protein CTAYLR_001933 [Chrysophaeum taylorii]
METTRPSRGVNQKAMYFGPRSCPICGKSYPSDQLMEHADRCAMRKFAEWPDRHNTSSRLGLPRAVPRKSMWSSKSTNPDTPLVVTFRHQPEDVSVDVSEVSARTATTSSSSSGPPSLEMARTRKRRKKGNDFMHELLRASHKIEKEEPKVDQTTLQGSWKRICSRAIADADRPSDLEEIIKAADDRIKGLPESSLVWTKANGELDARRNAEWQDLCADNEVRLVAFGAVQSKREAAVVRCRASNVLDVLATAAVAVDRTELISTLATASYEAAVAARVQPAKTLKVRRRESKRGHESSAVAAREYIARMQNVHKLSEDTIRAFARHLRAFQAAEISKERVTEEVAALLEGCPDLVKDFHKFLPTDAPSPTPDDLLASSPSPSQSAARPTSLLQSSVSSASSSTQTTLGGGLGHLKQQQQQQSRSLQAIPTRVHLAHAISNARVALAKDNAATQVFGWTIPGKAMAVSATTAKAIHSLALGHGTMSSFSSGFSCRTFSVPSPAEAAVASPCLPATKDDRPDPAPDHHGLIAAKTPPPPAEAATAAAAATTTPMVVAAATAGAAPHTVILAS